MTSIQLLGTVVGQIAALPLQLVQFVSFWTSVALPLFYIPLLYNGIKPGVGIFVGLLAVHVVSLILGHDYGREEEGRKVPE